MGHDMMLDQDWQRVADRVGAFASETAGEQKGKRMNEAERRSLILRYWENGGSDPGVARETYHDDAVLEFPQSAERFKGLANFQEWRNEYPAGVELVMGELRGQGDLWVGEGTISYDGGPSSPS